MKIGFPSVPAIAGATHRSGNSQSLDAAFPLPDARLPSLERRSLRMKTRCEALDAIIARLEAHSDWLDWHFDRLDARSRLLETRSETLDRYFDNREIRFHLLDERSRKLDALPPSLESLAPSLKTGSAVLNVRFSEENTGVEK